MQTPDIRSIKDRTWLVDARCRSEGSVADVFFGPCGRESTKARLRREAVAKQVCSQCAVRAPCLAEGIVHGDEFGIWGGHTARELHDARSKISAGATTAGVSVPN